MTAEINQGIRILLERMKSNPEEFEIDRIRSEEGLYRFRNSKWNFIHEYIRKDSWVTAEERKLIMDGISKVQAEAFTRQVMATLLKDEESDTLVRVDIIPENIFNTHKFSATAITANMLVGNQLLSLRQHLDANNSNSGNYHGSKK
jgi:hypothetical protein